MNDEERYVAQADALARGHLTLSGAHAIVISTGSRVISDYPPATSLLQAPLVAMAGWRAAGFVSVLGLLALALITRALLRAFELDARFALTVLAFPGALFFGRVAMSDMPNAALVALAILLFGRADRGRARDAFFAGLTGGMTLMFREPTVVLLFPFAVAALIRRRAGAAAIVAGGLVGVVLRLVVAAEMFGNPLYVRPSGYGFAWPASENVGVYAIVLLVMWPLGAILPVFYRGPQRREMQAAVGAYVLLLVCYSYVPWRENGIVNGTILASRFMLPLLPILAVSAADVLPRWLAALRAFPLPKLVMPSANWALVCVAFASHAAVRRLEQGPAKLVQVLHEHTRADVPVIINEGTEGKYLSSVYGPRSLVWRDSIDPSGAAELCRSQRAVQIAVLDRTDTPPFRADALMNERFLARMREAFQLRPLYDARHGAAMRLRIFDLGCGGAPGS